MERIKLIKYQLMSLEYTNNIVLLTIIRVSLKVRRFYFIRKLHLLYTAK